MITTNLQLISQANQNNRIPEDPSDDEVIRATMAVVYFVAFKFSVVLLMLKFEGDSKSSLEDQYFCLRLMKFGLFGWSNKRLVQTEEDDPIFIQSQLIDSYLTNSWIFIILFVIYLLYKCFWEYIPVVACAILQRKGDTKRGLSMRLVRFDLIRSIVTFDTPVLHFAKRGEVVLMGKSHEYDPETNRHDMVSRRESIAVEFLPN